MNAREEWWQHPNVEAAWRESLREEPRWELVRIDIQLPEGEAPKDFGIQCLECLQLTYQVRRVII